MCLYILGAQSNALLWCFLQGLFARIWYFLQLCVAMLLLVGVDVSKAKPDACTTQCHFLKNEDVIEGLFIY
jgi:hypothetical protein